VYGSGLTRAVQRQAIPRFAGHDSEHQMVLRDFREAGPHREIVVDGFRAGQFGDYRSELLSEKIKPDRF
jgi:hypothetical protein